MVKNAIVNAEQVTPERLNALLEEQGALTQGKVLSVTPCKTQSTFASSVSWLAVDYSQDTLPNAPKKLFLKISNPALAPGDFDPKQLRKEYDFYSLVAPDMADPITVPCYDAAFDPETGASHLLLKDVSETHAAGLGSTCPGIGEQAVDALAQLHATWWDHSRLGKDIGSYPTQEERQQEWANTEKSTTAFLAALGEQIPRRWRGIYERVLPALPWLFERHASGRNLTLVHGDAHLGNFLFPKEAETGQTYLIDWQFWHPTIGGTDLAFMMAAEWETETRRKLEMGLLQRYYSQLLARNVQRYAWTDCWGDYRLSVILVSIFIPVWRWSVFKWELDMDALQKSMTAFEDLNCYDLLRNP